MWGHWVLGISISILLHLSCHWFNCHKVSHQVVSAAMFWSTHVSAYRSYAEMPEISFFNNIFMKQARAGGTWLWFYPFLVFIPPYFLSYFPYRLTVWRQEMGNKSPGGPEFCLRFVTNALRHLQIPQLPKYRNVIRNIDDSYLSYYLDSWSLATVGRIVDIFSIFPADFDVEIPQSPIGLDLNNSISQTSFVALEKVMICGTNKFCWPSCRLSIQTRWIGNILVHGKTNRWTDIHATPPPGWHSIRHDALPNSIPSGH